MAVMVRAIYSLAWWFAMPFVLGYLLWRSRKQPEYRQHLGERFGFYRQPRPDGRLIWIHAVSVGETRATQSLVAALRETWPDCSILMTHMTPTGRAASAELYGGTVLRSYLPYEYGFSIRHFLRHFQPALGILIETEVWPNLVAECRHANIPLVLANARLSQKSLRKAQRWSGLIQPAVQGLTRILAQTEADAGRLLQAGATPAQLQVTGNLKFDVNVPQAQIELGRSFRERIGMRPVLLAASTRESEEALLLDAFKTAVLADGALPANTLLWLVPRHPQRFDAVANLIQERGLSMQRRSSDVPVSSDTQVWLGDSMGELLACYAAANIAFIGGSLLPLGGQNLIEACALGCPVLIGPHTFNFAQATEDAIAAGAALCVADAHQLMQQAASLLQDAERLQSMAAAARQFAENHRGATDRTMAALNRLSF